MEELNLNRSQRRKRSFFDEVEELAARQTKEGIYLK
jgi:hypothetical protein